MVELTGSANTRQRGFTLIELVMVMIVVGVLAVFAVPRMLDLTTWRLRAFADEMQSTTAAMQRLALAQRKPVIATFSTTPASALPMLLAQRWGQ